MLNNIDKNSPFRVPENYFQDFTTEMMSQLPEKDKKSKIVSIWKAKAKWIAVAAAFVGVAFLGANYLDNNTSSTQQQVASNQDQLASIQNDYYLFVEDEASESMYYDVFYSDQL